MLVRLDWVVKIWSRTDANLARFTRKPSEQLTQQMAFTPFVFEDVGALIDQSNPDLYLFSTDYPHTEGGRNPIARFETSLGDSLRLDSRSILLGEFSAHLSRSARVVAAARQSIRRQRRRTRKSAAAFTSEHICLNLDQASARLGRIRRICLRPASEECASPRHSRSTPK